VTVLANVPLELSANVEDLHVQVSITDTVADQHIGWGMAGMRVVLRPRADSDVTE